MNPDPSDSHHAMVERGRTLIEVLALADQLPQRHAPELEYPPFRSLALPERS